MRFPLVILAALVVVACEKSSSPGGGIQPSQETPTSASSPSSPASAPVPSAPSPSPSPSPSSAPSPGPSGETIQPATASGDAGKGREGGSATALKPVSKHVGGNNFALDLASPGCKAATECTMTIKLVASSDYHVNKEYPYKFTALPAPNVEFLGKDNAATFTRASGDFVEQGEKTGIMTVRFKPASPGEASVKGTYKFSVCSADQCQIEQEKLELSIPVLLVHA